MSACAKFVIVIAALRGVTAIAEPPIPLERGTVIESFAITRGTSALLLLPMTVFRKPILAVLDTGSELSVYDKSLHNSLGNPQGVITADTPQGSRQVELFLAPSPSVGKIRLDHDSQFVVCYDLVNIRRATKCDVRALIGMDLLRRSVIRIDPERAVIDFLADVGTIRLSAIPLKGEADGPSVVGTIPGIGERRFVIDTGSAGSGSNMLDAETFDALLRGGELSPTGELLGTGLFGTTAKRSGRLREPFILGETRTGGVVFTCARKNTLGLEYLSNYVVTFDFPRHLLLLEPHSQRADTAIRWTTPKKQKTTRCRGRLKRDRQ